jgi:hypothetical protein
VIRPATSLALHVIQSIYTIMLHKLPASPAQPSKLRVTMELTPQHEVASQMPTPQHAMASFVSVALSPLCWNHTTAIMACRLDCYKIPPQSWPWVFTGYV